MPDRSVDVLLIGGGVASATCAQTLREEGFDGSVLLATRELDPPYDRPPLTKEYLRGEQGRGASAVKKCAAPRLGKCAAKVLQSGHSTGSTRAQ